MLESNLIYDYSCWKLINLETGGFELILLLVLGHPKIQVAMHPQI